MLAGLCTAIWHLLRYCCYDSPWIGLLTSGDNGCHRWIAMEVKMTPLGRYNINRTTWERFCQIHDIDIQQLDSRHMLLD